MSILAALCFLVALILFVLDGLSLDPSPRFRLLSIALAFLTAGLMAVFGFRL